MDITHALNWRYATKQFDPSRKISESDLTTLTDSLHLAPSSYGLQPWKFMFIRNTATREKLKAVSWNQTQVTDAAEYVVLVIKEKMDEAHIRKFIAATAEVRGTPIEALKGYEEMMLGDLVKGPRAQQITAWAQRQAYIAMGFLMETAALLKVDSCPMEGLDPKAYDEILGLTGSGWGTVAAVALGYRAATDKYASAKKVRFPKSEVVLFLDK